ncbi:MAG: tetratricopeptide repeat protein [Anaerolineae bacterium]
MSRKKRKKKRPPARKTRSAPPRYMLERLAEAEQLTKKKRLPEARDLLEDLNRRYPRRAEVLTDLVNVYYDLHDLLSYQYACEQLLQVAPDNGDAALGLAGAYLSNLYPVLALRAFQHFLQRWPDHERAVEVRGTVAELEGELPDLFAELGVSDDETGWRIAIQHEEMQVYLAQGQFQQVRRLAEAILKHDPQFAPALNNISLSHWADGRLDKALEAAQRVLEFEPANIHALSNVIHFLCAGGRSDEAAVYAERLKASTEPGWDRWLKKAEGLSFVGDDEGVLDVFRQAERAQDEVAPGQSSAFLAHLAAVAALRLGREDKARSYWKQALKHQPGFKLARENLADLRLPVGERNVPWPFPLTHWLSPKALKDLGQFAESAVPSTDEGKMQNAARRFLREYPEVVAVAPSLLEYGNDRMRELAVMLAELTRAPELLEALKSFALRQCGRDALRHKAARIVNEAGLLPSGTTRMWMSGEWRDILLLGFEIYSEPDEKHSPRVQEWAQEAMDALFVEDWPRAERLLDQALAVEPDAPDLLNNRALSYVLQGRAEEAEAILRQIHERNPDYLFARVGLAQRHVERGELEAARELLEPLLHRKRLHFSEFDGMCGGFVQLTLAEGDRDAARSWFGLWESVDPDNPKLDVFRLQVHNPFQFSGLRNRLLGRRRRP